MITKNLLRLSIWTVGDVVLIGALVIICFGSYWSIRSLNQDGTSVIIELNGKIIHQRAIYTNDTITIHGSIGDTVIQIKNGAVAIVSSPCPRHFCQHAGAIHRSGEMLVCVPNRVAVRITSDANTGFDVITE
jgi:hypothetical protein